LARVKRVLNDYTLDRQFGDVPIGLGKMLLFLSTKMLAMSQVELGDALGHVTFNRSFQIEVATRPAVRRATCFTRASQRAESDFRLRRLLRYFFARGQSPL